MKKRISIIAIVVIWVCVFYQQINMMEGKKMLNAVEQLERISTEANLAVITFEETNTTLKYQGKDLEELIYKITPGITFDKSYKKQIQSEIESSYLTMKFYDKDTYIDSYKIYKLKDKLLIDKDRNLISFLMNNNDCIIMFHDMYWDNRCKDSIEIDMD